MRRKAGDIPKTSPLRLAELAAMTDDQIDTSDIPERDGTARRVVRDEAGRLPKRQPGLIRAAILAEIEARRMTRYELWKLATAHCNTLSQSAVYEYLHGTREIGTGYAEAIMKAVGLVVKSEPSSPIKGSK